MTLPLNVSPGFPQPLNLPGACAARVHVYDEESIDAINAALGARRPLLVRGEPGTGKSQLAAAAAATLERPFVQKVIDARTTSGELLYTFDAVARLAEAQLAGALCQTKTLDEARVRQDLAEQRFVRPGPLWWALDWKSAKEHAEPLGLAIPAAPKTWKEEQGVVVLIDEIDKADSDVPNGLLEALGAGTFTPRGFDKPICPEGDSRPLVVVTTNEERALPDAFVRRCLVLHLALPDSPDELRKLLVDRGKAHFPRASKDVLDHAAELLVDDRKKARQKRLSPPGQAEYLDLVRAVTDLCTTAAEQSALLDRIKRYALEKHPKDGTG